MSGLSFYFDEDISSIESSSRRERKYSEERISEQATMIKSLSTAVKRLADTLETKEAELETKEAELETKEAIIETKEAELQTTKVAALQLEDRAIDCVDLESKVLDLMIENAELKNQVTDLKEGAAAQKTPNSKQLKNDKTTPATAATSNDSYSLERVRGLPKDKENGENVSHVNSSVTSKAAIQAYQPRSRQSVGPSLTKCIIPRKLVPNLKSGLGGRSFFANLEGKRLSCSKLDGIFPKLVPRHISIFDESNPDDLSDLS